jgi:hypothetical protein
MNASFNHREAASLTLCAKILPAEPVSHPPDTQESATEAVVKQAEMLANELTGNAA